MKKKVIACLLALSIISSPMVTFACGENLDIRSINNPTINDNYILREVSWFYDYKESDSYTYEGKAFRVSETISTDSEGGHLEVSESETVRISWGGSLDYSMKKAIKAGLSFEYNKSLTTSVGHCLNVAPNKDAYIVAIPVYNVSVGKLYTYHGQRLESTDRIKVKVPDHYKYKLRYE